MTKNLSSEFKVEWETTIQESEGPDYFTEKYARLIHIPTGKVLYEEKQTEENIYMWGTVWGGVHWMKIVDNNLVVEYFEGEDKIFSLKELLEKSK